MTLADLFNRARLGIIYHQDGGPPCWLIDYITPVNRSILNPNAAREQGLCGVEANSPVVQGEQMLGWGHWREEWRLTDNWGGTVHIAAAPRETP